eukprot:1819452-Prymnesium_polylepis.3
MSASRDILPQPGTVPRAKWNTKSSVALVLPWSCKYVCISPYARSSVWGSSSSGLGGAQHISLETSMRQAADFILPWLELEKRRSEYTIADCSPHIRGDGGGQMPQTSLSHRSAHLPRRSMKCPELM